MGQELEQLSFTMSADATALVKQTGAALDVIKRQAAAIQAEMDKSGSQMWQSFGKHQNGQDMEARRRETREALDMELKLQVAKAKGEKDVVASLEKEVTLRRTIQQLERAGASHPEAKLAAERHVADLEAATKIGGPQLNRNQAMELAHAVRATFDGLAAGQNPLRILMMESGRVAQALGSGPGGLGGALGAIASLFNPVVAGVVAVTAVMGLAIAAEQGYESSHLRLLQLYEGIGRGSQTTAAQVEALAEANNRAGRGTVAASEQYAQALLSIRGMTAENLGSAIGIVEAYAHATGQEAPQALSALAKAFADPKAGVVDLSRELKAFTPEQVRAAQAMADAGDKAGALKIMMAGIKDAVGPATGELTLFGKILEGVKNLLSGGWHSVGKTLYRATHELTTDDLPDLKERLKNFRGYGPDGGAAQLMTLQQDIARLEAMAAKEAPGKKKKADEAARNADAQAFADETGITSGTVRERAGLKAQLKRLQDAALPKGDKHGATDAEINAQIAVIEGRLKGMDHKASKAPPPDTTNSFDKSTTDDLNRATAARAAAEAEMTKDIVERARLEKLAINAAMDKQRADLDARRVEIAASKGDRNKSAQLGRLDAADAQIDLQQAAKERAVDIRLAADLEAADLERSRALASVRLAELNAALALAKTAEQRGALQQQVLDAERAEADLQLKAQRQKALSADPGHADMINKGFDVLQAVQDKTFSERSQAVTDNSRSPWAAWLEEGRKSNAEMAEATQAYATRGLDQLNNGLAEAAVNFRDLGDVAKSVIHQMEADLLKFGLKQGEIALADGFKSAGGLPGIVSGLGHLLGFAGGGDPPVGRPSWVGENGPELFVPKSAGTIIPADMSRRVAALGGGRSSQVIQPIINVAGPTYTLNNPVMVDELLSQMNAISAGHALNAASRAVDTVRRQSDAWNRSDYMLSR
jgi:phage-related minor tail protein